MKNRIIGSRIKGVTKIVMVVNGRPVIFCSQILGDGVWRSVNSATKKLKVRRVR